MTERPIIFSGPMVLAILAGTKTQTRRVAMRRHFSAEFHARGPAVGVQQALAEMFHAPHVRRPYGVPGDRLWVRETFRQHPGSTSVHYAADPDEVSGGPWRSPIYMPRWASRVAIEVTAVRVERLQDITEDDAIAEGMTTDPRPGKVNGQPATLHPMSHRQAYIWAWDMLNAKRGHAWASNPWVWCVSFRRIEPGARASA